MPKTKRQKDLEFMAQSIDELHGLYVSGKKNEAIRLAFILATAAAQWQPFEEPMSGVYFGLNSVMDACHYVVLDMTERKANKKNAEVILELVLESMERL